VAKALFSVRQLSSWRDCLDCGIMICVAGPQPRYWDVGVGFRWQL